MRHRFLAGAALVLMAGSAQAQKLEGAGAVYDPLTLTLEGPQMDERTGDNPFSDVRLDVVFSQGSQQWIIPGYFAGCKDAADSSCTGGKLWQVHFLPSVAGDYQWQVRFRAGKDVVFEEYGGKTLPGNGAKGNFTVGEAQNDPVRARGILRYTGDRYYRYSGDNSIFFKLGPDAPENLLAYDGFDATPNFKSLRKNWAPHLSDYNAKEAKSYLWAKGKKGQAMLGMFRYVADQNLNSVSMLLWNTGGDDRNVFPHLLTVEPSEYEQMKPAEQWTKGTIKDRFDLSKLAQWQRALSYADKLGLHLHFKLQETENDRFMDGGETGRTRKLYLREMVARFGHYLALSWNLGEENVQKSGDVVHMSHYIDALDAYDRPIVLHSYPHQKERYLPYLGNGSALNGLSLQGSNDDFADVRPDIADWAAMSKQAGRPWVMSYDEPGSAQGGAGVDAAYPATKLPSERKTIIDPEHFMREVVWNSLTAGGNGIEAYYGYETGCTDLNCQDHRTRAEMWREGVLALSFFRTYVGEKAASMAPYDWLTANGDDYVFADPGRTYVIMPGKDEISLKLAGENGRFDVDWFDRGLGGALQKGSLASVEMSQASTSAKAAVSIGSPPPGAAANGWRWYAVQPMKRLWLRQRALLRSAMTAFGAGIELMRTAVPHRHPTPMTSI